MSFKKIFKNSFEMQYAIHHDYFNRRTFFVLRKNLDFDVLEYKEEIQGEPVNYMKENFNRIILSFAKDVIKKESNVTSG